MNSGVLRAYPRGILDRRYRAPQLSALLDLLVDAYPDPDAFASVEAFSRAQHDDIAALDDEVLDAERILGRIRRAAEVLAGIDSPWLSERIARLEREAGRRKARRR